MDSPWKREVTLDLCPHCGQPTATHDHRADLSGLDDGPYLPGQAPRKKSERTLQQMSADRMRAWETRRAKYGKYGHR